MRKNLLATCTFVSFLAFASSANSADWRAEFGIGTHGGDPEVSFAGATDDLDTDNGLAITGQLWADGVAEKMPWLTLGAQYLRLSDSDFSETASGTVLGVAVTGQLDLDPTIDAFLINAAYRKPDGKFHPIIGGGIGVAKSSIDATASATFTVNGQNFVASGTADDDDSNFAWQMFAGMDYDLTDKAYLGASITYFGTDANLFGADIEFRNVVGMAKIGYRF